MPFKFIDESKAPPVPPKKGGSGSAAYFAEIIEGLSKGRVAVIEPAEGQSSRGVKISVGRVAASRGIKVVSWSEEGKDTVYVKLLSD